MTIGPCLAETFMPGGQEAGVLVHCGNGLFLVCTAGACPPGWAFPDVGFRLSARLLIIAGYQSLRQYPRHSGARKAWDARLRRGEGAATVRLGLSFGLLRGTLPDVLPLTLDNLLATALRAALRRATWDKRARTNLKLRDWVLPVEPYNAKVRQFRRVPAARWSRQSGTDSNAQSLISGLLSLPSAGPGVRPQGPLSPLPIAQKRQRTGSTDTLVLPPPLIVQVTRPFTIPSGQGETTNKIHASSPTHNNNIDPASWAPLVPGHRGTQPPSIQRRVRMELEIEHSITAYKVTQEKRKRLT